MSRIELPTASSGMLPQGLPGPLPRGERILWQGRPTAWGAIARLMHGRAVALWFAGLTTWGVLTAETSGGSAGVLASTVPTLVAGAAALGLVALLGWFASRTTTYTLTDRRLVMEVGIALPITLNIPFAMIEGAGLHVFRDGSGDIPIRLRAGERIAYLHLWPHARAWHLAEPQPMLRSVAEAGTVARTFAQALQASRANQEEEAGPPILVERPVSAKRGPRLATATAR